LIKPGELLAIRSDVVVEDRGAFFWLFAPATSATERCGDVSVIRVNGPLEYHDDGWGESYESIVSRVGKAMSGEDVVDAWRREHRWDGQPGDPPDAVPSKAIVLRIDSPGGVVAGLGQTVDKLRKMSRDAKVPLYAYVDETCYSAGFALACACEQIVLPRAGFLGSIGVISTLVDQSRADKKMGLRFVVLTSGKRKADGHPHVPISDAMIAEEAPRVIQLAKQFYGIVNRARGVGIDTIRGWEASRFLGAEAKRVGLADAVMGWDEFLGAVTDKFKSDAKETKGLARPVPAVSTSKANKAETSMGLDIDALIGRTEKALVAEKDPKKLAALATNLEAYKKTKHSIEKHETEEGEEDDEDEEDDEEESEESKGDETDRGDDEEDDEDEEDDDEDAKKSKKSKAVVKSPKPRAARPESPEASVMAAVIELTGHTDASQAIAALRGLAEGSRQLTQRMAKIEKDTRKANRDTAIDKALNARRITKHEARTLRTKKMAFVEQFLAMRPKAIVDTDEKDMPRPDQDMKSMSQLPEHVREMVQRHVAMAKAAGSKTITEEKVLAGLNGNSNGKVEV
jgi:ClpP class serine protease